MNTQAIELRAQLKLIRGIISNGANSIEYLTRIANEIDRQLEALPTAQPTEVYVPVSAEDVEALDWYAWDKGGMIYHKKGVPIEDVFILRQEVLELLKNEI